MVVVVVVVGLDRAGRAGRAQRGWYAGLVEQTMNGARTVLELHRASATKVAVPARISHGDGEGAHAADGRDAVCLVDAAVRRVHLEGRRRVEEVVHEHPWGGEEAHGVIILGVTSTRASSCTCTTKPSLRSP